MEGKGTHKVLFLPKDLQAAYQLPGKEEIFLSGIATPKFSRLLQTAPHEYF